MDIPQRPYGAGEPAVIGDLFRLRKRSCTRWLEAVCELRCHESGWECRLSVGDDLLRSAVCRSGQDVRTCSEQWKAAMIGKGWQ